MGIIRLQDGISVMHRIGVIQGTGLEGPMGPKGNTGPQGDPGPTGPTGAGGSVGDSWTRCYKSAGQNLTDSSNNTITWPNVDVDELTAVPLSDNANFQPLNSGLYQVTLSVIVNLDSGDELAIALNNSNNSPTFWAGSTMFGVDNDNDARHTCSFILKWTYNASKYIWVTMYPQGIPHTTTVLGGSSITLNRIGSGAVGADGPEGPQGEDGPQGETGPSGDAGSGYETYADLIAP